MYTCCNLIIEFTEFSRNTWIFYLCYIQIFPNALRKWECQHCDAYQEYWANGCQPLTREAKVWLMLSCLCWNIRMQMVFPNIPTMDTTVIITPTIQNSKSALTSELLLIFQNVFFTQVYFFSAFNNHKHYYQIIVLNECRQTPLLPENIVFIYHTFR